MAVVHHCRGCMRSKREQEDKETHLVAIWFDQPPPQPPQQQYPIPLLVLQQPQPMHPPLLLSAKQLQGPQSRYELTGHSSRKSIRSTSAPPLATYAPPQLNLASSRPPPNWWTPPQVAPIERSFQRVYAPPGSEKCCHIGKRHITLQKGHVQRLKEWNRIHTKHNDHGEDQESVFYGERSRHWLSGWTGDCWAVVVDIQGWLAHQ